MSNENMGSANAKARPQLTIKEREIKTHGPFNEAVSVEIQFQERRWGNEHDQRHTLGEWQDILEERLQKLGYNVAGLERVSLVNREYNQIGRERIRHNLVELAALCETVDQWLVEAMPDGLSPYEIAVAKALATEGRITRLTRALNAQMAYDDAIRSNLPGDIYDAVYAKIAAFKELTPEDLAAPSK